MAAVGAVAGIVAAVTGVALLVWPHVDLGDLVAERPVGGGSTTVTVSGPERVVSPMQTESWQPGRTPSPTIGRVVPSASVSMPTVTLTSVSPSQVARTVQPTQPLQPTGPPRVTPSRTMTHTVTPAPTPLESSVAPAADDQTLLPTVTTLPSAQNLALLTE